MYLTKYQNFRANKNGIIHSTLFTESVIFQISRIPSRSPVIWFIIKIDSSVSWSAVPSPKSVTWLFSFTLKLSSPPLILRHPIVPPHHGVKGIKSPHNVSKWGATIGSLCLFLPQSLLPLGVFQRISYSLKHLLQLLNSISLGLLLPRSLPSFIAVESPLSSPSSTFSSFLLFKVCCLR